MTAPEAPLLQVVLFEPENAGNVGNVARTCAVLGAELHLIRPFGFRLHDREFTRAAMDYLAGVTLHDHASWSAFAASLAPGARIHAFSARAQSRHTATRFERGDYLLFGPESRGLPDWLTGALPGVVIPHPAGGRSLNLAVAVGVGSYEAARQILGW